VRVNGRAVLTGGPAVTRSLEQGGRHPRTVVVVTLSEVYFQCAKALMRSGLWSRGGESPRLPSAGQFIRERDAAFDAETYDLTYPEDASTRMW